MVKPRLHGGKTSDMEPMPAPLCHRVTQHITPRSQTAPCSTVEYYVRPAGAVKHLALPQTAAWCSTESALLARLA